MKRPVVAAGAAGALLASGLLAPAAVAQDGEPPGVLPTPQQVQIGGEGLEIADGIEVLPVAQTDPYALEALVAALTERGVEPVVLDPGAAPTGPALRLGPAEDDAVGGELDATSPPSAAEGYSLEIGPDGVVIAGTDGAGQFYGVQTLRQLLRETPELPGAAIEDAPAMELRGSIEGFYGEPWTHEERLDHLDFLGSVKANTYVYAPKDDPYHRDQWRDPYPAQELEQIGELVERARRNHVQFTFAISPGVSICYSDPDHRADLEAKLDAIHELGATSFYVALDDIAYTEWNCTADEEAYGPADQESAAEAQVDLLNDVQRTWVERHDDVRPLQMVPTEYGDITPSPYKDVIRERLDEQIVVQWTGTDVVPTSITEEDAEAVSELFGRNVFLWDNYPVNDFGDTAGRLLLGPYAYRDPGLSQHLSGIVSNPMNQPYASELVVASVAEFAWNDADFDAEESWLRSIWLQADGDAALSAALAVFADLQRLAPTFGAEPWQPQAPGLEAVAEEFWSQWQGEPQAALETLGGYGEMLAAAPGVIRDGASAGFVADAADWLAATELWSEALTAAIDSLEARLAGDEEAAADHAATAEEAVSAAEDVAIDPLRNRWPEDSRVKVGDGVLDVLVADLLAADVPEPSPGPTDEPTEDPTGEPTEEPTTGPDEGEEPTPDASPTGPGGDLPATGANLGWVAGIVAALLLVGVLAVVLARRRGR